MIRLSTRGDFKKSSEWLQKLKHIFRMSIPDILEKYGKMGVEALSAATPIDSGVTASSWYYTVNIGSDSASLSFFNSNINKGVPIALILQFGHGTGTGGWVEGRDYINPAIQPIFDELEKKIFREVTKA